MLALAFVIRFTLEICLIAVAVWFPFQAATGLKAAALSVGSVIVLLAIWGTFLSPKRRIEIGGLPRLFLEMALFSVATEALYSRGQWQLAAALIGAALVDKLAVVMLERRL